MGITFDQAMRGRITATLIVVSVLVVAVITGMLMMISPDQSPVQPKDATKPEPSFISPLPFRFPEEGQYPGEEDRKWRILGSNKPAKDNRKMIRGFLKHRILHFTFDDGPVAGMTSRILDTLSAYNIQATFFVVGKHLFGPDAQAHRDLLRRIENDGHTVAVHSYTHIDFRQLSASDIDRELYRSGRVIESILGYRPGLFRPPFGGRSKRTNSLLLSDGYTEILWNIAPEEYGASSPGEILHNFRAALDRQEKNNKGPGGIVLLHDKRPGTVQALPLMMEELRGRNCSLVHQDHQELWDVVGDLSYFMLYDNGLPDELVAQRQTMARTAALRYCEGSKSVRMP